MSFGVLTLRCLRHSIQFVPEATLHFAFGPVPSRRLGRSLGINNIPDKICSYSCIYCQVGPTTEKCIEPRRFASPQQICDAIEAHLAKRQGRDRAAGYAGTLISETMLLAGLNDSTDALTALADFLAGIAPGTAYLAVPTRPTHVEGIQGSDAAGLIRAHELFAAKLPNVELITGRETGDFAHTGDARNDLLAITAVHPMREAAVRRLLAENNAEWALIGELVAAGLVKVVEYAGERFYLRTMPG
jgi:wyosine [tRNA(Phe)-imidazoG37] synthetase (radical SAM superfamily)